MRNQNNSGYYDKGYYRSTIGIRYSPDAWQCFSFVGSIWNNINKAERKLYLKNAYRVLLTRARQGMVIVVPEGDEEDGTRKKEYYDATFEYLKGIGISIFIKPI
jgi:hypothetical protein